MSRKSDNDAERDAQADRVIERSDRQNPDRRATGDRREAVRRTRADRRAAPKKKK